MDLGGCTARPGAQLDGAVGQLAVGGHPGKLWSDHMDRVDGSTSVHRAWETVLAQIESDLADGSVGVEVLGLVRTQTRSVPTAGASLVARPSVQAGDPALATERLQRHIHGYYSQTGFVHADA